MGFKQLRQSTPIEEFDYQFLMSHLTEYANKRDVVTRWLKDEKLVRVKKGLYTFGADHRKGLVCKETLANQIYGPSYISLEYALSFYGMIPERVDTLTSVTTGRSRRFITPIGTFSYRHLPTEKFAAGIVLQQYDDYHSAFIATPEKAVLDYVYFSRGLTGKIPLADYFYRDLRIEESSLKALSLTLLSEFATQYRSAKVHRVIKFIMGLHNHA